MDLYVATLIIQDAQFAARKAADHCPAHADRRNGFFGLTRRR